jgi:hypothetical protein
MNWTQAKKALERGNFVGRISWTRSPDGGLLAKNPEPMPGQAAEDAIICYTDCPEKIASSTVVVFDAFNETGAWVPWTPELEDLYAHDWYSAEVGETPQVSRGLP